MMNNMRWASILFPSAACFGQEHAPTVAQCQADYVVWYDIAEVTDFYNAETEFIRNKVPNRTVLNKLPIETVLQRAAEMGVCRRVDSVQKSNYDDAAALYHGIELARMSDFIERHNLFNKFVLDDKFGLR
jgi:hypothetical protein